MSRIILTFQSLHQVLAAEELLKVAPQAFFYRPTPTPPGLTTSICGMAIEILEHKQKSAILQYLEDQSATPEGVHEVV